MDVEGLPGAVSSNVVRRVGLDQVPPLAQTRGVVIVVTGPIASGKSTVAKALARELELMDVRAAVVDLDLVHDQLTTNGSGSDESTWTLARRELATVANALEEEGVAVVIADGSFNMPVDRATLARHLRPSFRLVFVTLQVSFEEALRRAQGDPTRGRPRILGFWVHTSRHGAKFWPQFQQPTS